MVRGNIFYGTQKWFFPFFLVVVFLLLVSTLNTYIYKNNQETREYLTMKNNQPPARNASVEKAEQILPYLQAYLNSQYPTRADLLNNDDRDESKKTRDQNDWEDLTQNKKDFRWKSLPVKKDGGFLTKDNTLHGPPSQSFNVDSNKELTVIIHSTSLGKETAESQKEDEITAGDVVQNAQMEIAGEKGKMTIHIPANVRDQFNSLKKLLQDKQTQKTVEKTLDLSQQIAKQLQQQKSANPDVHLKKKKNNTSIRFHGNNDVALEIAIPKGDHGLLQVAVGGILYHSKLPVMASNDYFYSIVYKDGDLKAFVNKAKVIDTKVRYKIYFDEKPVSVNPSGKWNANLKIISILNRALHPSELSLFRAKGIIVKALAEQYQKKNLVPGLKHPKGCKCVGFCKVKGMPGFNPYDKHPKIPDGEKADCKAACVCHDREPYDPYDPDRIPDENEYRNINLTPYGPGSDWISPEDTCPRVTRDDYGNYIWNGVSYGRNRKKAREIYHINNPFCRVVPYLLDNRYDGRRSLDKRCPFMIKSPVNPCFYEECDEVDWKNDQPENIKKRCKKRIATYCEENAHLDDMCTCWQSEFKDKKICRDFRRKIDDPYDHGCNPGAFQISEHPDYDKYIRKDKVPCFGCDLEQSSGRETCPPNL
jgi:hypothetical protein